MFDQFVKLDRQVWPSSRDQAVSDVTGVRQVPTTPPNEDVEETNNNEAMSVCCTRKIVAVCEENPPNPQNTPNPIAVESNHATAGQNHTRAGQNHTPAGQNHTPVDRVPSPRVQPTLNNDSPVVQRDGACAEPVTG